MFFSGTHFLPQFVRRSSLLFSKKNFNTSVLKYRGNHAINQVEYIKSALEENGEDWMTLKNQVLNIEGSINKKNFDGILLKLLINNKKIDAGLSFAEHLKKSPEELSLGSTNGILGLYYQIGIEKALSDKEKDFILETYKKLYNKYKYLDSTTCERLLHALCVIDEWKKAMKVLDDIHQSNKPTHSAYSTLIATLFKLKKKSEALKLIDKSLRDKRPLQHIAYQEWINYILTKYKDKKTIAKYLEEICVHISENFIMVTEETAERIKETYKSLDWDAQFTRIKKINGQCYSCKESLQCLKLDVEEFVLLQKNVKEKLIVGADLFLKTSPDELKKFLSYVEQTGPYDIVLDCLNIAYTVGNQNYDKMSTLVYVVKYFQDQDKRLLLLGRKHMLHWPKMKYLLRDTCNFFTDNVSQDDPYFITAAILSGPNTDIVSKDLLRGHKFNLQDDHLQRLFQKWQWQHQWMVFLRKYGPPTIQEPLAATPCAQKLSSGWHLPYHREESTFGQVRDGVPAWNTWLCLRPRNTK